MKYKLKSQYNQYGLTLIEVALSIFILAVVTIGLTDLIESNTKSLTKRTDAELLKNLEVVIQQYIVEHPQLLVAHDKIEVKIDDMKKAGLLGNFKQSNFYDAIKIYVRPMFNSYSKYFFAAGYLIVYSPDSNGKSQTKYNSIERGQLINNIGEKAGLYSDQELKVIGLSGGWNVELADYSDQEAAEPVTTKTHKIYVHSIIPLTNNESEIISLACFNTMNSMDCSAETVHYTCNGISSNDDDKLIFTYSGHDVDSAVLTDSNNNISQQTIDNTSLVYELKLSEFCNVSHGKGQPFIFKPVITPLNSLGIIGKPFNYNYDITLERD